MRVIHWLSAAAVLIWLIGAFVRVGQVSQLAALDEEPERLARVRPMGTEEAPRSPAPPQPATPAKPPPQEPEEVAADRGGPAPRLVGAAEFAEGEALLDAAGDFPALSLSYEAFPSFGAYARAMQRLGARFVVVRSRDILGEVDLESGAVVPPALGASFSPRARDYRDEPGLARTARALRKRFGPRAVVMMLVPRSLDAGLFGGVARALEQRGESREGLREILGRYERTDSGGVHLRLLAALRRDGSRIAMDAVFDLAQIQRTGRG